MIYACERDAERVQTRRSEYQAEIAAINGRLKFLDEAGSNLALEAPLWTRRAGCAGI